MSNDFFTPKGIKFIIGLGIGGSIGRTQKKG